ncbi:MAG: Asp-tRNA(Asn)/Glu-tRNA(Gln) amidotransferase subunit GatC [Bacteroidota bacterium]
MEVNDALVDQLAHLARLEFNDEAREKIKTDLTEMLAFVEKLSELDTDNVEPLIYMSEEVNVLREDVVQQDISHEEALKNAPKRDSDYFKVPKVLDQQ